VEVPRTIFDDCLAKKFIEQAGPEDSDGRGDAGRTRVEIARAVSQMTVTKEMHATILQAKGARWVIIGLAGIAGLASGLLAKVTPWSATWP
jgi:hypothetical protein